MLSLKDEIKKVLCAGRRDAAEIEEAYRFLREVHKNANDHAVRAAVLSFRVGEKVQVIPAKGTRRLPALAVGRVERLGQKNLTVNFGKYLTWRVPATFLQSAPAGAVVKGVSNDDLFAEIDERRGVGRGRRRPQYEETPPDKA
jgi:hypothetical protein